MEMKVKIYIGLFILALIGSFITAYNHAISENGRLTQEKTNLEQALKDSKSNLLLFQDVASSNASAIIEAEKNKRVLNKYALTIAKELEILKNENSEIKKWSLANLPDILSDRLHEFAYSNIKTNFSTVASGNATTNTRTGIIVSNESLYQYSIDGVTQLRSCNADKAGFLKAYAVVKDRMK
jgi:hypothetical protein